MNIQTIQKLPRMRTAAAAAAELKAMDPDTYLTERALRRLVHEGRIPFVAVGKRHLINLDWLIDQLAAGESFAAPSAEELAAQRWGKIRPISGAER